MSDIASSHYTKYIGSRSATWYLDENKVRAILDERGITCEQLSRMMFKCASAVRVTLRSARAGHAFRLSTVRELADALHVDVTDIATERKGERTMGISGDGTRGAAWRVNAAKVRAIMYWRGLTSKRLGEMMRKSYYCVTGTLRYARQGHLFKLSTVQELADALGVQVNDIAVYVPPEKRWTNSD